MAVLGKKSVLLAAGGGGGEAAGERSEPSRRSVSAGGFRPRVRSARHT